MKLRPLLFFSLLAITFTFCRSKKEQITAPTSIIPPKTSTEVVAVTHPVGLNLGNTAPAISMKNPEGQLVSLASLKGKLVLIDFWASWCGPCRFENPAIVKAYAVYKDKKLKGADGFTIYSVSLDANADLWTKAIEKDCLTWDYHVSDLRGWNNEAAAKYGVTAIPANFLIDENGIIIGKNLRGDQLMQTLEKLSQ